MSERRGEDDLAFPPTPTWDQAATEAALKPLKALGDGYAQFLNLVMGTVGQFQGLNNSMHARQHRQLREAQDQDEQLVASILEFRAAQVEAEEDRKADDAPPTCAPSWPGTRSSSSATPPRPSCWRRASRPTSLT